MANLLSTNPGASAYGTDDEDNAGSGARPLAISTRPYNPITVANDPELDANVRAANASQAARPRAIPNSTVQQAANYPAAMDPDNPGGAPAAPSGGGGFSPLGAVNNFFRPGSTSAQSYRSANNIAEPGPAQAAVSSLTVSPSTSQPRAPFSDRAQGPAVSDAVSVPVRPGIVSSAAQPGMTTEQANQIYGDQNTIANAANAMASNYSAQVGAENARRVSPYEARIAQREADMKSFDATQGADAILGSPGLYKDQRAALRARAADGQARASALDAQSRAPSTVTPPNLVQAAVAQTEAGQKARSGAYDLQKGALAVQGGQQALQKGGLDIKAQQAHLDAVNELQNAKTPDMQAAAERKLLALAGKTEPGWKAQVVPGGIDPNTGQMAPSSVLYYNQFTNQHQLFNAQGQDYSAGAQQKPQYQQGELRMDPETKKVYKYDGKNWNPN